MKFKLFECKKDVLSEMFTALLFYFVFYFMQTLKEAQQIFYSKALII